MNFPRNRMIATLSATLLLTACGGGGGGGDSKAPEAEKPSIPETPAAPSVITKADSIQLSELSEDTYTVAGEITEIEALISGAGLSVTTSGNTLAVSAAELNNDSLSRVKISHQSGEQPYETILSITGINTSALPLITQGERIVQRATDNMILADERRLGEILLELQYLAGITTPAEKDLTLDTIKEAIDQAVADTETLKSNLASAIQAYKAGESGEDSLIEELTRMETGLQGAGEIGQLVLDGMSTTLQALGVTLPETLEMAYDPNLGRYTRFTHESLGGYDENGAWAFDEAYDWLNAALPLTTN